MSGSLKRMLDALLPMRCIDSRMAAIERSLVDIGYMQRFLHVAGTCQWLRGTTFHFSEWSASASFLYVLYRLIIGFRPSNILEYGLGQSSRLLWKFVAHAQSSSRLSVVEHDSEWLEFFLRENPDFDPAVIWLSELYERIFESFRTTAYRYPFPPSNRGPYDLVVIDGPFGSDRFSRSQAIDVVTEGLLAKKFAVLIDDYDRSGEQETVSLMRAMLGKQGIQTKVTLFGGNRQQCLVAPESSRFIFSF